MITSDGKDGGGQIFRTALGLSSITGKACTIENIRIGRPQPGLREQQLQGLLSMQKLCNAAITGAKVGSTKVIFKPNRIISGDLEVNISTAGSIGLILQVLLIPATKTNLDISITGGATYNKWAPPVSHFNNVLFPLLSRMGYNPTVNIIKHGFYPKGGARIDVISPEAKLKPLNITKKGNIQSIKIKSIASKSLQKKEVAERQAKAAENLLNSKFQFPIDTNIEYVDSLNPGTGIQITLETDSTVYGGDSVGERKKLAEDVGKEAAQSLINSYDNGTVDVHTADMLLPYIALAKGSYTAPKITNHIKTNIKVIEQFLDVKFKVKDRLIVAENI